MKTISVEWNGERVSLTDESDAVLMDAMQAMLRYRMEVDHLRLFPKASLSFFMDDCKVRYVAHSILLDRADG